MRVLEKYEKQIQMQKMIVKERDDLLGKLNKDFKKRKQDNAQA